MIRFEGTAKVLIWPITKLTKEPQGWLTASNHSKLLANLIGQTLPYYLLLDETRAHDPNPMKAYKVVPLREPGWFMVNDHQVFMPLGKTGCDCEFYMHTNGNTLCPHMIEVMKYLIANKRWKDE